MRNFPRGPLPGNSIIPLLAALAVFAVLAGSAVLGTARRTVTVHSTVIMAGLRDAAAAALMLAAGGLLLLAARKTAGHTGQHAPGAATPVLEPVPEPAPAPDFSVRPEAVRWSKPAPTDIVDRHRDGEPNLAGWED